MNLRSIVAVSVVALAALACGPQESATDAGGSWVGTITPEGNVTTVVNESGSVWGGTARLVEEASIGVEEGPEEQLFGFLAGVSMTLGRIFVLDAQLRLIRSYDASGNHPVDCGGPGQGPGELDPSTLYLELGTSTEGRVFAHAGNEIEVFSAECEHLETLAVPPAAMTLAASMMVSHDGVPYLSVPTGREGHPSQWIYGMQAFGSEGPAGEPIPQPTFDFERDELELQHRLASGGVAISRTSPPYAPDLVWGMMPSGAMVGGVSSDYRFEIIHPDGHRTVVENTGEPVRLSGDEADWYARRFLALLHGDRIVDSPSWNASELLEVKPAFYRFLPDRSGRLWVLRSGEGERLQGCDERARAYSDFSESPCWRDPTVVEVFGPDGRYLGRVDVPEEMRWSPPPYIRDDNVVATAEDEAGTIMVKRYRLVLPGER
ncbi:MAG: hypothetical protein IH849_14115 [Acidobacteria bacterium]|nr:hypothetical protein [Acidobacteriota bacterium]